jgi:phosphoglycolate phosphatase-like HAD superfamily hydrolase
VSALPLLAFNEYGGVMEKRKAWIFDVDGTLCNVDSILHYIVDKDRTTEKFKKDFNKFHAESVNCAPHKEVVDMVWDVNDWNKGDIIIVTARKEEWRAHTSYWLEAVAGIPHTALFMRGNKDGRSDYEVKKDILEHIKLFWEPVHAVDDNPKIIQLWEENGIPTTKIGTWDGN